MPDNSLNDANLEPGTGIARDLFLTEGGDLALLAGDLVLVRGREAIAQEIRIRLRFFLGEWFLDVLAGVDHFNQVLTKPPNLPRASDVLVRAIAATPGVASVEEVRLQFIGEDRRLEASYRALLESGETVEGQVEV